MKLKLIWKYYVKGHYHCDQCKYCWVESYYESDDCDCGCHIKGDIQDSCRLIPPFKNIIGNVRKRKATYLLNHQYDGFGEFCEERDNQLSEFNKVLIDAISPYKLICPGVDNDIEIPIEDWVASNSWEIRDKYDEIAHPIEHITLKQQWINVIKASFSKVLNKFKPYFCK